jgi:hypothetical protein
MTMVLQSVPAGDQSLVFMNISSINFGANASHVQGKLKLMTST